ncbi:1930_t:CDS:2 [Funneliformis geosporum]|nr:1930_t:CDS:2 [Funneliformis geosporum]
MTPEQETENTYPKTTLEYNVGPSTITDILKKSEKWLAIDPNSSIRNTKKFRFSPYKDIEDALTIWVDKAPNVGMYISGKGASAPIDQLSKMRKEIKKAIQGNYELENVFNCDEIGLF